MQSSQPQPLLFRQVNNSPLVLFRVLFGLVFMAECFGALATGWVTETYITAPFNFTFIGFEWLHVLHGPKMYWYYVLMGIAALGVMLGMWYRASSLLLAIMWTAVYLSQKSHYNNHYYLMVLLCWLMLLVPAHRRWSADVRRGAVAPANTCSVWIIWLFRFQIACIYVFAAIAKLNPDWLQAMPLRLWLPYLGDMPVLGILLREEWFSWFIAYTGVTYDMFVVPALLWKPTRKYAVIVSFVFHIMNSVIFQIGTFPYMALSLLVFFFEGKTFDRLVKTAKNANDIQPLPKYQTLITTLLVTYATIQAILPLRHYFVQGNVNWTEEGHRMSWRMMLRTKVGTTRFIVKDKATNNVWIETPQAHLAAHQWGDIGTYPDLCWQFARYLKDFYKEKGFDVEVYAENNQSLNGAPEQPLIDPSVDLAAIPWQHFGHKDWVLLRK